MKLQSYIRVICAIEGTLTYEKGGDQAIMSVLDVVSGLSGDLKVHKKCLGYVLTLHSK